MVSIEEILNKTRLIRSYRENISNDIMYLEQLANDLDIAQNRGANLGDTINQVINQKNNIQINFDLVKQLLDNKYVDLQVVKNRMINIDYSNLLNSININTDDTNEVRYIEIYAALVSNKNALEGIKTQLEDWNNNNFDGINLLDINPILQLINDILLGLSELELTLEEAVSRLRDISTEIGESQGTVVTGPSGETGPSVDTDLTGETGSAGETVSDGETGSTGLNGNPDFTQFSNINKSQMSYLDIGLTPWWSFADWSTSPPGVNISSFDNYFGSIFQQLKNAGVDELIISFAQIRNIPVLKPDISDIWLNSDLVQDITDNYVPGTDLFRQYLGEYPDAVKRMVTLGKQYNIKFNLAFGGANAREEDYYIAPGQGEFYAQILLRILEYLEIDGVDIDLELNSFNTLNCLNELHEFFRKLKNELDPQNKTMSLAVLAGIDDWTNNIAKSLFYDQQHNKIFNTMFNRLNLMAYDAGTKYYFYSSPLGSDPVNGWSLNAWAEIIGDSTKLNLGFQDATPYNQRSSWAAPFSSKPYPFSLPENNNLTAGEAARYIYNEVEQQAGLQFGKCFWWPNEGPNFIQRYTLKDDGTADFMTHVMADFYNYQ